MHRRLGCILWIGWLALSACTLPITPAATPDMAQAVAGTLTALAPTAALTGTVAPLPTAPVATPAVTAAPLPSPTETGAPATPTGQSGTAWVAAFTLSQAVEFRRPDGMVMGLIGLPAATFRGPRSLHFGGPATQLEAGTLPIFYYSADQGQESIRLRQGADDVLWNPAPGFLGMVGAPGKPVIAYSLMWTAGNTLTSGLFLGTPDMPPEAPALVQPADQGRVMLPVALDMPGDFPQGIWFTTVPTAVGGAAYPPQRGLFYYHLATQQVTTILEPTTTWDTGESYDNFFLGLSPDHTWLALHSRGPNVRPGTLIWKPLAQPDAARSLAPDLPVDDLFVGPVSFSPDGARLLWSLAIPQSSGDFQYLVQAATVDGTMLLSQVPSALSPFGDDVRYALPMAWTDAGHFVLEAHLANGLQRLLWSDASGQYLSAMGDGQFAGLLWP